MLASRGIAILSALTISLTGIGSDLADALQQSNVAIKSLLDSITYNDTKEVTICVAGDNLIHSRILKSGITADGYDYTAIYEPIKDVIESYDLAIINQETILINDPVQYSGTFPKFGSPTAIGDAVIDAGFDVALHATNHVWDRGEQGVIDSIDFWNEHDIPYVGIHKDKEESDVQILEVNEIKIALLNVTYGTNGLDVPTDKKFMVDMLYDTDSLIESLQYAEDNADITIVFPHWGVEYNHDVTDEQRKLAQIMADNGADIIVGTHPHVIEPVERILSDKGKEVLVYWSLGNFLSNQDEVPRMLGLLANIKIRKDKTGTYFVQQLDIPTVTHIESYSNYFEVYPLLDYTEELASEHRLRRIKGESFSYDNLLKLYEEVIKPDSIEFEELED